MRRRWIFSVGECELPGVSESLSVGSEPEHAVEQVRAGRVKNLQQTIAMKIPLTWRYLLAFYCLGALMGMSHELAHHAAGFAICGHWGYKTFNFFELAKGCAETHPHSYWLATLAGPVLFNYLPLWIGVALMKKPDAGARLSKRRISPLAIAAHASMPGARPLSSRANSPADA